MKKLQAAGIIIAIIILVGMFFIPPTDALPIAARNTLGLLLAVIVLLVTEAFPIGVTCLVAIAFMALFKCAGANTTVGSVLGGYNNQVLFFVLASFGISEALTIVPLSRRMLVTLMRKFGQNVNSLLFAIMLCTAVLSSVISNVAAAAVFIPIVQKFLDIYDNPEDRKKTARCYMIALPVASQIGGMMTPAGSSINMLAIGQLRNITGMEIRFVEWMLFGIPLALAILPISWLLFIKIFRPAPISREKITAYLDEVQVRGKFSAKENYVLLIVLAMLVLWILSSWFPIFNITIVALIGLFLFFLPGFEILTWADFKRCVSWEAFFLMGTMISMSGVITASGLSKWIAAVVFPASFSAPAFLAVALVAALIFLLLIPIPVAPALVTMLAAPLILFAQNIGVNPYLLVLTMGLMAGNCYILPLDTVPLITFATGAYKMFDMPKATVWIQLTLIVLAALWIPLVAKFIGI